MGLRRLPAKSFQDPLGNPVRLLFEVVIGAANLESLLFMGAAHNASHGLVLTATLGERLAH
jgi:hypothetical protein